jgi:hypothetical protein
MLKRQAKNNWKQAAIYPFHLFRGHREKSCFRCPNVHPTDIHYITRESVTSYLSLSPELYLQVRISSSRAYLVNNSSCSCLHILLVKILNSLFQAIKHYRVVCWEVTHSVSQRVQPPEPECMIVWDISHLSFDSSGRILFFKLPGFSCLELMTSRSASSLAVNPASPMLWNVLKCCLRRLPLLAADRGKLASEVSKHWIYSHL